MEPTEAIRRIEKIQALTEDLLEQFPEGESFMIAFNELMDANQKIGRVADLIAVEGNQ